MQEVGGGHQVACHLPREKRFQIWANEIKPKL